VAELKANGIEDASMATGESGQFDVFADGELVFSKEQVDRHAEPGEVLGLLQAR
jgi:hypothetical protein